MRRILVVSLIALGIGAIGLSVWINWSAGHASGVTDEASHQLAALFGLVDLAKVGFLTAATILIASKARAFAVSLAIAGTLMLTLSFANVSGRIGQLRATSAAAVETSAELAGDSRAELSRSRERLAALGTIEPPAAIEARLSALRTDKRWNKTAECTDATLTDSRSWCADYRKAQAELARGEEAQRLEARIAELRTTVAATGSAAGSREGDWLAGLVARLSGIGDVLVRDVFALVAAAAIELTASLAFPAAVHLSQLSPSQARREANHVVSDATGTSYPAAEPTSEPSIGSVLRFAVQCLDHEPGGSVIVARLYEPYRIWCEARSEQALSELEFAKEFRHHAKEAGFAIQKRGGSVSIANVTLRAVA